MTEETQKEIELEVRRLFSADAGQHRQYLEGQFSQLKWAVSIVLLLATSAIIYFSGKTYAELLDFAKTQVNDRVVDVVFNASAREKLQNRLAFAIEVDPDNQKKINELVLNKVTAAVDVEGGKRLNDAVKKKLDEIAKVFDPKKNLLPRGIIIPWDAKDPKPDGWAICDGTAGTPNLSGRFLIGTVSTNEVGQVGGSTSHSHPVFKGGRDGSGFQAEGNQCAIALTGQADSLPPYYKVIYLIKL